MFPHRVHFSILPQGDGEKVKDQDAADGSGDEEDGKVYYFPSFSQIFCVFHCLNVISSCFVVKRMGRRVPKRSRPA